MMLGNMQHALRQFVFPDAQQAHKPPSDVQLLLLVSEQFVLIKVAIEEDRQTESTVAKEFTGRVVLVQAQLGLVTFGVGPLAVAADGVFGRSAFG